MLSVFFRFLDRKVNGLFGAGRLLLSCVPHAVKNVLLKNYAIRKIAPILNVDKLLSGFPA